MLEELCYNNRWGYSGVGSAQNWILHSSAQLQGNTCRCNQVRFYSHKRVQDDIIMLAFCKAMEFAINFDHPNKA